MPKQTDQQTLLEIYKLHAELTDRVSQRREVANRLFVSLLSGIIVSFFALLRFGDGAISPQAITLISGVLGFSLSVAWLIVIRSYRQLNRGRFATLHELEKKLPYDFFRREWKFLGKGENKCKYWPLSSVEALLPWIFIVAFIVLFIYSFCV